MRGRRLLIVPVVSLGVLLTPGVASAHPVGTPGTPSCFGERISHGSSDHKLTPGDRAAGLQAFVDEGDPLALELFGDTVSIGEFAWFVRVNCSDDPILLPFQ